MEIGIIGIVVTVVAGAGVAFWQNYEKKQVEEERQKLQGEKEEYEETIQETRNIIKDLQKIICGDEELTEGELTDMLDRLESTILPKDDQILSKLDRIQYQVGKEEGS